MVASLGLTRAVVPERFPLGIADRLRADGVELVVDQQLLRRAATAQVGRRAGGDPGCPEGGRGRNGGDRCAAARGRSRRTAGASVDGEPLTCELLRAAAAAAFAAHGCRGDDMIVAHGAQAADGHEPGHGRVENDDVVLCDLFPQHVASACFADMTRTFRVGAADAELTEWHAQCVEALELAMAMVRPGIEGGAIHRAVCAFFEERGHLTQLTPTGGRASRPRASTTASATASGSRCTRHRA